MSMFVQSAGPTTSEVFHVGRVVVQEVHEARALVHAAAGGNQRLLAFRHGLLSG